MLYLLFIHCRVRGFVSRNATVFEQRFQNLGQMGNINARKGLQIMKRCWKTNEDWITAAEKLVLI